MLIHDNRPITIWAGTATLQLYAPEMISPVWDQDFYLTYLLEDVDGRNWITVHDHRLWVREAYRQAGSDDDTLFREKGERLLTGVTFVEVRQTWSISYGGWKVHLNIYHAQRGATPEALLRFSYNEIRDVANHELFFKAVGHSGLFTVTTEENRAVCYRGVSTIRKGGQMIYLDTSMHVVESGAFLDMSAHAQHFVATGELPLGSTSNLRTDVTPYAPNVE